LTVLTNAKRIYALADYTVECKPNGWYYARTCRFGERSEMKGPYSSMSSITLMIARELKREITKRDLSAVCGDER
jgi:hypothetical protein